ncbi:MAG: EscU/YscU/HrcU family type III secretion system export apparatus switch protein [Solirubrobacteraceae bacterium]|nr:EscU/YscU/HrcU family type III secretion system export apparatus switch protein [Solirubrobacteraceae bacterium]
MAGEKTEKATPKRKEESRNKGQVAKSMDLGGSAVLLAGLITIGAFGPKIIGSLQQFLVTSLKTAATPDKLDGPGLGAYAREAGEVLVAAVLPVAMACALAAAVMMAGQVGIKLTPKAIKPDFKKMNPIQNAKQVFGMNALVELVKNLAKVGSVAVVVWLILKPQMAEVGTLVGMEPAALGNRMLSVAMQVAKAAAAAYFVIGVADYVWQKHKMDKSMKMDLQEVKDEHKTAELPPEVRMAMRRRQMTASRARMMAAIPDADVVVTNPTHYAVALKYDPATMAPTVVAKGMDLVAKTIRELATDSGVMIVPDPPLARALHASVEVGDAIPEEMYEAVAAVLAFVYRTAARRAAA